MKKMLLLGLICILVSSLVLAVNTQGIHEPGTGIDDPELKEANQGTGQGNEVTETGQGVPVTTSIQQQNEGEETQIQNQVQAKVQIKSGEYTTTSGKPVQVQVQSNNKIKLTSNQFSAESSMEMTQEQVENKTKVKVKLSNGKNSEIKIMPDVAAEKAIERLRLKVCSEDNNCQIELKEVGEGEQIKAAYEVQAQKQAKFLGLFETKMQVQAQVDAETGEVIQTKKPWWAFLTIE